MRLALLFEKMYLRKKIDEASLPQWLGHATYLFLSLRFFIIYPAIGIGLFFVLKARILDMTLISTLCCILAIIDARDFPIKNYLIYTLHQNVIVDRTESFRKIYRHIYFYFFGKTVFKFSLIFFVPMFMVENQLNIIYFVLLVIIIIIIVMNFSSYHFYRSYFQKGIGQNIRLVKLILVCFTAYIVLLAMFHYFKSEIIQVYNHFQFDLFNILTELLITCLVLFILSMVFHHHKVFRKIGKEELNAKETVVQNKVGFKKRVFFNKDILLIKRTYYNKLRFLKYLYVLQVCALAIVPVLVSLLLKGNDSYILLSIIFIAVAFSNFITDYLKKVISPDIEFFALPPNTAWNISLNEILVQKVYIYLILSGIPVIFSVITMVILHIPYSFITGVALLIVFVFINMGLAATIGAILFPKINPESDYEIGNSSKAVVFENVYLYIISILLSFIFIMEIFSLEMPFQLGKYIVTLIVIQISILVVAILYLRNTKVKDVMKNAN
ncbi:hypothetical protein MMZ59_01235 [Bacillus altitudinis]|uniref:hypothetical protein n=1 Tax=Bacillus altitudinis TaxID=293387 RepID=UPI001F4ED67D|nr:hypothetical protein [Bacillus altitudinis]UNG01427.1 hypothetical protein MMZ59_01235 [Bacillus altitudinis]